MRKVKPCWKLEKWSLSITELWRNSMKKLVDSVIYLKKANWRIYIADLCHISREKDKNPSLSNYEFFRHCGSKEVSKGTRCQILNQVAKHMRLITRSPLKVINQENWMKSATECIKTDFSTVLFTDECLSTFRGSNG